MKATHFTHDPYVAREESPVGVARRALFNVLIGLEALHSGGPCSVSVSSGMAYLGTLELAGRGVVLAAPEASPVAIAELAGRVVEWTREPGGPVTLASTAARSSTSSAPTSSVSCAALFAHACALVEPTAAADQAAQAYRSTRAPGHCAILLRLRQRPELLPYPIEARELGELKLRPMLELCHAAASLVARRPGATAPMPNGDWAPLFAGERTFGVLSGETHIAVMEMSRDEVAALRASGNTRPDARDGSETTDAG